MGIFRFIFGGGKPEGSPAGERAAWSTVSGGAVAAAVRAGLAEARAGKVAFENGDEARERLRRLWEPVEENDEDGLDGILDLTITSGDDDIGAASLADVVDYIPSERRHRGEGRGQEWLIGMSHDFLSTIGSVDKSLKGRVLDAIATLAKQPLVPHGDTVKPLSGEFKGLWRYRIGDFRLVYRPDPANQRVCLLALAPRGSVYD